MTSAPALLEKRSPAAAGRAAERGRASRVHARVLVRDAPDLTSDDQALLDENGSTTAIVLTWAWTDEQRELDPWAEEFRVYTSSGGVGPVPGFVTAVTDLGGGRFVADLRARGNHRRRARRLPAGRRRVPHPRARRRRDDTGPVETLVPAERQLPRAAPRADRPPVPLTGEQSRPDAWDVRLEVVSITSAEEYELVLRDLLRRARTPRTSVWLGVTPPTRSRTLPTRCPAEGRGQEGRSARSASLPRGRSSMLPRSRCSPR